MKLRLHVFALTLLVATAACTEGPPDRPPADMSALAFMDQVNAETIAGRTSALTNSYMPIGYYPNIGGILGGSPTPAIRSLKTDFRLPFCPIGPGPLSYFNYIMMLDTGNISSGSRLWWQVSLVNGPDIIPTQSYYTVTANACVNGVCSAWLSMNVACHESFQHSVEMLWKDSVITFFDIDQLGHVVQQPSTALHFDGGITPLTVARTPELVFGVDADEVFGGCMHDILQYDQPGPDIGDFKVSNFFGASDPFFPVYLTAPLTNPRCSVNTIVHSGSTQYDNVQWHVDGF